jgi:glycosyltransferase involved in cell wall biosynthesis
MNVVLRGPLLSISGYGVHSRQVFQWAESKGWRINSLVLPWGINPYYVNPDAQNGLIGRIMQTTQPFGENESIDLSLQIQLPNEWDPNLAKVNIGITAGVETTLCNPEWIQACNRMDHIVVPSEFTKKVFIDSGLSPDRISAIPEAFTCDLSETSRSKNLSKSMDTIPTKFNLLVFGQITGQDPESDRKNTFYNIKWLAELFAGDPDVGIIIKTNTGRLSVQDRERSAMILKELVSQVRTGPYPRFYLTHGLMDESEISALYRHDIVKALVAPTRGEGWGLPILDAAVCGLPVIATKWSGHLDFMKQVKFLDLDYDLVPVPEHKIDNQIFMAGAKWADVKESHFKARLEKFRKSPGPPTQWAQTAAPSVGEKYSLKNIFPIYDEKLGGLIDGP